MEKKKNILICPYCNLHLEEEKDIKLALDFGGCPACGLGRYWDLDEIQSSKESVSDDED